jgi:hypothetical protein
MICGDTPSIRDTLVGGPKTVTAERGTWVDAIDLENGVDRASGVAQKRDRATEWHAKCLAQMRGLAA